MLLERLHPAVLDVAISPKGLDVVVGDPVILDPAERPLVEPAAVVLAVGVDAERARVTLLRSLGVAGVAACIVKQQGPLPEPVLDAAAEAGVALLMAPPALSWGQLYSLLLTAVRSASAGSGQVGEVPLGDLFALANAIAAAVGGATTIEDSTNRVLAYSNLDHVIDTARQETILGRQVPVGWIQRLHEAGVFKRLWQSDEVVRIADFAADDGDYLSRVAVAVRAGGELLGSIWVIEGSHPLGDEAARALRDAADVAALHLLRHRASTDVDRRRRTEALLALLDGSGAVQMAADLLGISADGPTAVAAFRVATGTHEGDASAVVAAARVADLAAVYCESYRRQAACGATGDRVYLLAPIPARDDLAPVVALADAIVERAERALRLSVRCGVAAAGSLDQAPVARREADQVVEVVERYPELRVGTIGGFRSQVILQRLVDLAAGDPSMLAGKVAALAEQDASKATTWIPTLRAYFDAFGDMAAAAAKVNVHPNTFRYRLRRIVEVFGLDLDDPDERLVAELQLRFLDARQ